MKPTSIICSLAASLLVCATAFCGDNTSRNSPWDAAAQNRDAAAHAQSNQALMLLGQVDEIRVTNDFDSAAERRKHFAGIGNLEMAVGGLFMKARGNFQMAAASWKKAASDYGKQDTDATARTTNQMQAESRSSATHSLHLAAQAYERAAVAYDVNHAGDFSRSGAANEKAAQCRELIAKSA